MVACGKGNMLKLKNLFENFDLAKDCLKQYDTDWESLDRYFPYFRVSSNAIYPFRAKKAEKVCFLRLSPVEEKSIKDVRSEIQLIEWLIGQGFPAMKPFPMKDGRLWAVVDTKWGVYNMSCFEAVPGKTLEDCEGSPRLIAGYGRTLGQMHRLLRSYPFAETRRDHHALMAEIRERLIQYRAPEKLMAEWNRVNAELDTLPIDPAVYGFIHYDFEADNVLYSSKTDSFGVIDFDDAVRCWYALDVARALDCLSDVDDSADPSEAEAAFMKGYREACAFSEEQLSSVPLMRRLVRLQEYGSILYTLSEPVNDAPEWMTEIVEKLENRLQSIENSLE